MGRGRPGLPTKEECTLAYGELAADTRAATEGTGPADVPASDRADLIDVIRASLEDDKAEDILVVDLGGRSSMADAMVIASGRSSRQVGAISEKLLERLKARYGFTARTEGMETADWVLIDAGDVVVHVFRPEVREFYQLERLWQPAGGGTAQG